MLLQILEVEEVVVEMVELQLEQVVAGVQDLSVSDS